MRALRQTTALFLATLSFTLMAATNTPTAPNTAPTSAPGAQLPRFVSPPPEIQAKAYLLIDYDSNQILASKNADQRIEPASLTKMMTMYVVSNALKSGQIKMDSKVPISENAWKSEGSRMFVKVHTDVEVSELLKGIIVASGNDACVAMAEYLAGTEDAFAKLMNQTAERLGMKNSHFMSSTGMPDPDHYSTPADLALLAKSLIRDFPEDYSWYKLKWFTYNDIKQPNRNRLLWRDPSVDGLKTGHTNSAGFCLVASAKRDNTRLISVVVDAPSDDSRINGSQTLLTYGFRYFETHKLFSANTPLKESRVWLGRNTTTPFGVSEDFAVTIPTGQYSRVNASLSFDSELKAPIVKGQRYGTVKVTLDGKELTSQPLIALADNPKGNILWRMKDRITLTFKRWIG